jgi:hypothetical protein
MRDLFLKFADEAEWLANAPEQDPGNLAIDVIGIRWREVEPATYDDDGNEISPAVMEPAPGWRVNLRVLDNRDLDAFEPFRVFPTHPMRVWA